ncbi:ATP synthase F1 subcomplex epsilon subunit [Leucobacter komagatae]|uniref:ATP synthase F1 subcomplex epsilon subunit n=1 Tax=Leucobacter komagatae TaxID=55969 RepID=A0A542Y5J9_9MICO|nr:F0F1 ATP synthase subunit epsilon [Leucobacter komagatae]TQL43341.1 ATP synthase F1 subcomplex epsilon subunit [Leucobacter komagatae]
MALNVKVVSATSEIWSGAASQVVANTVEGEIGILTGHQPFLALLAKGEVRVTTEAGEKVTVNAEDGFLSVDHDTVTVVAGDAVLVA